MGALSLPFLFPYLSIDLPIQSFDGRVSWILAPPPIPFLLQVNDLPRKARCKLFATAGWDEALQTLEEDLLEGGCTLRRR